LSVLTLLVLACGSACAGEARFFEGLDDIPLMEGFAQSPGDAYLFDKPEGRIAGVEAQGPGIARAAAEEYYRRALPQFGWKPKGVEDGGFVFRREKEELRLEVTDGPDGARLHIVVSPL
jgi:hypothetical protein